MTRHISLIPLSRFHRSCLFLALVAKKNAPPVKGYPTDIQGKINYATSFYKGPFKNHFQLEERLWSYVSDKSNQLREIIESLILERQQLKQLFNTLVENQSEDSLNQIGALLEKHVRKEERVLFQQIQSDLTEEELSQIPKLLE